MVSTRGGAPEANQQSGRVPRRSNLGGWDGKPSRPVQIQGSWPIRRWWPPHPTGSSGCCAPTGGALSVFRWCVYGLLLLGVKAEEDESLLAVVAVVCGGSSTGSSLDKCRSVMLKRQNHKGSAQCDGPVIPAAERRGILVDPKGHQVGVVNPYVRSAISTGVCRLPDSVVVDP